MITSAVAITEERRTELAVDIAGSAAAVCQMPELTRTFPYARCFTIVGGTSEIMRNTIAERLLRLPREPLGK